MAERNIVKVQVQDLTRYGFKDAEGYVSWSKNLSETDKALVVPGASFEAEYYVSDKGTRYLNKIVARSEKVDAPKTFTSKKVEKGTDEAKPKFTPKAEAPAKAVDWDAKDRSQLVGGRSHDAAELVSVSLTTQTPMAEVLTLYREALEGVLKIAGEVK